MQPLVTMRDDRKPDLTGQGPATPDVKSDVHPAGKRQPAIPFVLVAVFLDVLGIGLIIPVLPTLIGQFTSGFDSQAYWYGLLSMVYGVMQFFFAPLLGTLSDRFGRRPVLLLSIFGLGLDFLLMAFSSSLWMLVIARIIGGITGASFTVAAAYIADVTTEENRSKGLGAIGAAFGMGFICGPVLGGVLGGIDVRYPFYVAAGLSLLNWLYGYFVLPESLPLEKRSTVSLRKANPFVALRGLSRMRDVGGLIWVFAFTVLGQFILQTIWVLYTAMRFGWGPRQNGISLFVVGLTAAIVQAGLLGWLLKRIGEVRTVLLGLCSATIACIAYGLVQQGWMMYLIIFANLLSFAAGPALQGLISKNVDPREQGLVMGSLSSLSSLATIFSPLIGTPILAAVGHLSTSDVRVGAPFFLIALLQAIALFLAIRFFRRRVMSR
jgi:DHA1 family tetracycline resistance protein-like MFS transporter